MISHPLYYPILAATLCDKQGKNNFLYFTDVETEVQRAEITLRCHPLSWWRNWDQISDS